MGNMKVKTLLLVLAAIWVCSLSILVVSARDCPPIVEEEENEVVVSARDCPPIAEEEENEEDNLLGFTTITFDTAGATKATYRNFLRDLRNKLKDKAVPGPHGIPVTRHSVRADSQDRYLLVQIGPKGNRVTLALDVEDLYLLGFRDRYNNKNRDQFLQGVPRVAQDVLSKREDLRLPIPFDGSYLALERKAGDRANIDLGIAKLENAIKSVYGLPPTARDRDRRVATFLIIAIQMVAEAARFKHIEEKVLSSIEGKGKYGSFKPDTCMLGLQTHWNQLSEAALRGTEAQFRQRLGALRCPVGENAIPQYMGILKYSSRGYYISFLKLYDTVSTD